MLCRYMINANLGIPHEYYNPIHARTISARFGLSGAEHLEWRSRGRLRRYLARRAGHDGRLDFIRQYNDLLLSRRTAGGVFAAKVQYWQYCRALDNPVGRELLDDGLFIHLYREDLLSQAVSVHFAHLTGRWGFDDAVTTTPAENPDFFDFDAIDRQVEAMAAEDHGWRMFFARNGITPMAFSYEALCRDPPGFVAAIAERLGVDPATLRTGYSERDRHEEGAAGLPSKREVRRRYLEARRRVRPLAAPAYSRESASALA